MYVCSHAHTHNIKKGFSLKRSSLRIGKRLTVRNDVSDGGIFFFLLILQKVFYLINQHVHKTNTKHKHLHLHITHTHTQKKTDTHQKKITYKPT